MAKGGRKRNPQSLGWRSSGCALQSVMAGAGRKLAGCRMSSATWEEAEAVGPAVVAAGTLPHPVGRPPQVCLSTVEPAGVGEVRNVLITQVTGGGGWE